MEFLTNSILYSMLQTHRELLRSYGGTDITNKPVKVKKSFHYERILTAMGDVLIQAGTRLKAYSYRKVASQEASAPTFMIML